MQSCARGFLTLTKKSIFGDTLLLYKSLKDQSVQKNDYVYNAHLMINRIKIIN